MDNASDDEDDGSQPALFVHSDSDNSSVSDDNDMVAILDEEEIFGQDTSTWD